MKPLSNNTNFISSNAFENLAKDLSWVDANAELITKLEAGYDVLGDTKADILEIRHYGFIVGSLNLLINEDLNSEILEDRSIYPIPLLPDWVIGASNVRGVAVPIIDLEYFLTNKNKLAESSNYRVLVIGKEENAIGVLINNLPKPVFFEKDNASSDFTRLPKEFRPFAAFGYEKNHELWVNIDFVSFFESFKT